MKQKIILAYSGGLDTSVILVWLISKGYEVICFVANVGQQEDFELVRKKALALGASRVYICDLQQEFIQNYIFPALGANAVYEDNYLLGTALARPLIAAKQIEFARQENTSYVAHGATGKGNDQVRFELAYMKLMPEVHIISPWKMAEFLDQFQGRSDLIQYAQKHDIPICSTLAKPYSIDENLMHTSYEGGILEEPDCRPPEAIFKKTASLLTAPDQETLIAIEFKKGIPISVTNRSTRECATGSLELFTYLNQLGGINGIGRIDIVENRAIGIKSRGVYETPGGTILLKAHRDLETIVLDKEVKYLKDSLVPLIARLIYNGLWFSPEMDFLMAAISQSQHNVEGIVFMSLYKGNAWVTGRQSSRSLYNTALSSMDKHGGYDQSDAQGYIKIQGLRLQLVPGCSYD